MSLPRCFADTTSTERLRLVSFHSIRTSYVVISARTFSEYNKTCKDLAQDAPVYIRGTGNYGDRQDGGRFKASMINLLGVQEFYEDDPVQIRIIAKLAPDCRIFRVFLVNGETRVEESQ